MGPEWKLSTHERPLVAFVCVCVFAAFGGSVLPQVLTNP